MKKFLCLMMLTGLLTGCGESGKKTTTVCKGNLDEITAATVEIKATGDKTDIMKSHVVYDFSNYISEEMPIDTYWLEQIKSMNVDYDSIKGASAKYSVDGNKIVLDIELDYSKADIDELKKAGLITSSEDKKVTYISLKQTINEQEKGGLTCKEK